MTWNKPLSLNLVLLEEDMMQKKIFRLGVLNSIGGGSSNIGGGSGDISNNIGAGSGDINRDLD